MTDHPLEPPRWQDYVLEHGEGLRHFWESHLSERERSILFILGKGFDPRMCQALEMLLKAGGIGRRDVLAIEFQEGPSSPSRIHRAQADTNWERLQDLISARGTIETRTVRMWSDDGRRISSRSASGILTGLIEFDEYTDLIIDISAMPRSIYFPLVGKTLHLLDQSSDSDGPKGLNIFVVVSENPILDSRIRDEGPDDTADYIHPFEGGLGMEATAELPRIWIPLLGEGQGVQLERIYDLVGPDEICPVLPSPSINPRRGDDLVLEYRELLFDRLRIDSRNFIYVSERNPFEVYRQVRRTVLHYREALQPLGGCKSVLSALSSKLMSVGALMVAYELKQKKVNIGVAHVESHGHVMSENAQMPLQKEQSEVFGLWLSGDCYET